MSIETPSNKEPVRMSDTEYLTAIKQRLDLHLNYRIEADQRWLVNRVVALEAELKRTKAALEAELRKLKPV